MSSSANERGSTGNVRAYAEPRRIFDFDQLLQQRNALIRARPKDFPNEKPVVIHTTQDLLSELNRVCGDEGIEPPSRESSVSQLDDNGLRKFEGNDASSPRRTETLTTKVTIGQIKKRRHVYDGRSTLFEMPVNHPIREAVITIVDSQLFEWAVLLCIIANSVFLAFDNPLDDDEDLRQVLDDAELAFTIIFTVEMVLKIIAFGFIGNEDEHTYLRDMWNVLDFLVVVGGYITYIPGLDSGNVSAVRSIRLLRPLRTVSGFHGMRILVNSMVKALPMMADVFVLTAFVFFLFGIAGMQLFGGKLRQRCLNDSTGAIVEYKDWTLCRIGAGPNDKFGCPAQTTCADSGINPNRGVSGFDNIFQSWVTIIQCTSLEGWVDVTYYTFEAVSYWGVLYYVGLILFVALFLLQLVTGVVYTAYLSCEEEEALKKRASDDVLLTELEQSSPLFNPDATLSDGGTYVVANPDGRFANGRQMAWVDDDDEKVPPPPPSPPAAAGDPESTSYSGHDNVRPLHSKELSSATQALMGEVEQRYDGSFRFGQTGRELTATTSGRPIFHETDDNNENATHPARKEPVRVPVPGNMVVVGGEGEEFEDTYVAGSPPDNSRKERRGSRRASRHHHHSIYDDDEIGAHVGRSGIEPWKPNNGLCMWNFRQVEKPGFQWFIMSMIVLNTALLASEHYNQPDYWEECLRISNFVFTAMFTLEVVMKMIAYGGCGFCRDRFNIFDFVVVVLSIAEILVTETAGGSGGGISAFRSLRLLRVFKLAQSWKSLNVLINTILISVLQMGYFSILLLLFIFIFALLGVQLFAGKLFDSDGEVSRSNFDKLGWALVAVFQIIGGENWNDLLYDAVAEVGWASSVYFILLFVIGNYLVLNLFLAILLANFDSDEDEDEDEEELEDSEGDGDKGDGDKGDDKLVKPPSDVVVDKLDEKDGGGDIEMVPLNTSSGNNDDTTGPVHNDTGAPSPFARGAARHHYDGDVEQSHPPPPPPGPPATGSSGDKPPLPSAQEVSGPVNGTNGTQPTVNADAVPSASNQGPPSSAPVNSQNGGHPGSNVASPSALTPVNASSSGQFSHSLITPGQSDRVIERGDSTAAENSTAEDNENGAAVSRVNTDPVLSAKNGDGQLSEPQGVQRTRSVNVASLGVTAGAQSAAQHSRNNQQPKGPAASPLGVRVRAATTQYHPRYHAEEGSEADDDMDEGIHITGSGFAVYGPVPKHRACFCLPHTAQLRVSLWHMVHKSWFENLILAVIIISTVLLAFDEHDLDSDSAIGQVLKYSDYVSTAIFTLEFIIKSIAMGFILNRRAYLRDGWNVLDFLIVVVSIMDIFFSGASFVKAFRALRCLRPLRMVSRFERMIVVVRSIFGAVPAICNVLLVSMLFYTVFGILGVNLFGGQFYWCEDATGDVDTTKGKAACLGTPGYAWKNPDIGNFDNIFFAVLTLFEVSTAEMWPDVLYRAVDIDGVDNPPVRDNKTSMSLYFVVFFIVGNFFITNLFVGVVVDTFTQQMDSIASGSTILTKRQQQWIELHRLVLSLSPPPPAPVPAANWRKAFHKLVTHEYFELGIAVLICLNIVVMSMWYYEPQDDYNWFLRIANWVFSVLFILEAVFKICGLGLRYFSDRWNVFDFVIILGSLMGFIFEASADFEEGGSFDPTILRVFRMLRMIRLIKRAQGLKNLIKTLVLSLPALTNVGALLLLLFFIYAVAGMQLFGGAQWGEQITRHANFDNFGLAVLTLFRMSTGESWNGLMHDVMRKPSNVCDQLPARECGSYVALPYFITFVILGQFMMLNLFIAVVLEEFESVGTKEEEGARKAISPQDLEAFSRLWAKYCSPPPWWQFWSSRGSDILRWDKFQLVLKELPAPLGVEPTPSQSRMQVIDSLPIPLLEGPDEDDALEDDPTRGAYRTAKGRALYVNFVDAILALSYRAMRTLNAPEIPERVTSGDFRDIPEDNERYDILKRKLQYRYRNFVYEDDNKEGSDNKEEQGSEPEVSRGDTVKSNMTLVDAIAASRLQAAWKGYRVRRRLRMMRDRELQRLEKERAANAKAADEAATKAAEDAAPQ